jgi:hypothetical protein
MEKGGLQGRYAVPHIPVWDGNPANCKCLMNCRCAHCNEITGFEEVLERSYPAQKASICGMESDVAVAIPSWPPIEILPKVTVLRPGLSPTIDRLYPTIA